MRDTSAVRSAWRNQPDVPRMSERLATTIGVVADTLAAERGIPEDVARAYLEAVADSFAAILTRWHRR